MDRADHVLEGRVILRDELQRGLPLGEEDRDLHAAGRRTPTRCDVLKADGFSLLLGPGYGSTRRWAARIVPILHAFLEESIARLALQSLMVRAELAGRLRPN
jgi:hypothetical protein